MPDHVHLLLQPLEKTKKHRQDACATSCRRPNLIPIGILVDKLQGEVRYYPLSSDTGETMLSQTPMIFFVVISHVKESITNRLPFLPIVSRKVSFFSRQ